jgi:hypothetical protein
MQVNLKVISDQDLLSRTQELVQTERDVLTKVLQHLREINLRRLYSDLGCQSLFEYAVRILKYSEGQAGRRIQAMKLLNEIPELEAKINSGALSLTNISQAQSFFREQAKDNAQSTAKILTKTKKLEILASLENKSSREGERELLRLAPSAAVPKEQERQVTEDLVEFKFVADQSLKDKLEEIRSLLGPAGAAMSFAELIAAMAELSGVALKEKKFGKNRARSEGVASPSAVSTLSPTSNPSSNPPSTPAPEENSSNPRYISKRLKHQVWTRDSGACVICKSRQNLNLDHIVPVAHGGNAAVNNLRLLCFSCNQRAGIKIFGVEKISGRNSSADTFQ